MNGVSFRRPTTFDPFILEANMRPDDRAEVVSSTGAHVLDVVRMSIAMSEVAHSVAFEEELACIYGVVAARRDSLLSERRGVAWLLTTTAVDRRPKLFWRCCKLVLSDLLLDWDELENAIDVRHTRAIRWAKRLGFQLGDPAPFGHEGRDFRRFRVRREDLTWETQSPSRR